MVLCKVLNDDLQVPSVLDRTRQACHFGVSDHQGYNRQICTISEGLVTAKSYLPSVKAFSQMNNGFWSWQLYVSQDILDT